MNLTQSLIQGFGAAERVLALNLAGVTHEESLVAPDAGGNCVNWIAGHLLASRGRILTLLGGEAVLSEEEMQPYRRGAKGFAPASALPLGRLTDGLQRSGNEILERLASLPEGSLDEMLDPSTFPVPPEIPTRGALISFLLFHESYHGGQIGLLRRMLGKKGGIA